ncbi:Hypothetical predicted protein [Pelobates cultripes]|uniref:Reverse transcriptase n=1 Tax=Pelobates cultripes TaxID=61616 RepID=A0AAD1VKW8_PELCU|nr:Hypothetical predicted protein [Pelobates cultripes]
MRHPDRGGLGFPDLKAYYHATHIANMLQMHSTTYTPQWISIEASCGGQTDLAAAMWMPKKLRNVPRDTLPTTKLLYNIWDNHRTAFCSARPWSMAKPLKTIALHNNTFPYRTWQAHNITHLHQICTEKGPLPLLTLQTKYNIPAKLTFSHWQLKTLLDSTTGNEPPPRFDPNLTSFEKMCLHLTPTQKTLSVCYRHINAHKPDPEWQFKKDWHRDINRTLMPDDWNHIYANHKGLTSITKLMFLTLTSASTLLAKHWKTPQIPSMAEVTAMVTTTLDYEVILWNQTKIGKGSATAKKIWTTYIEKKTLQAAARGTANTDTTT